MAISNIPTTEEAVKAYAIENSDPIDWQEDTDEILLSKINARIADAKPLHAKKCKEWKEADAYLDGDPSKIDPRKKKLIYNPVLPISRNMTGLVTDAKPNPSVRLVNLEEELPKEQREEMREVAGGLAESLEDWWDDVRGQSKLQRWVFGMWTYSDYFIMPYWSTKIKDVDVEPLKPSRVSLSPNADGVDNADYAIVDFFRSKQWMIGRFGDKARELVYSDYSEIRLDDEDGSEEGQERLLKNVCKLQLYMEAEWWAYKAGGTILEKIRNPFWALDEAGQRSAIEQTVRSKHERGGIKGVMDKVVEPIKGAMGMETMEDKIAAEIQGAMMNFKPRVNYMVFPKIPLIQFDTYRLGGELYSRSVLRQSIEAIDDINSRKHDIQENSEYLGKPNIFVDGKIMNEDQAKRIEKGKARGEVVRLNTGDNKSLQSSVYIAQGVPVPGQFFDNIEIDKREIDNLWGHHEVSRGGSDPSNKTKGGILALQEADQTPIRYVTRNIEDALQDLFAWVIQIRKMYRSGKYALESGTSVNYDMIDQHFKVFMKSGSMMPVSKEAQREEALELYRMSALDPLTLFERLNDPEPEKTAKRLEAWLQNKTVMTNDIDDQQMRVMEKIRAIQANAFDKIAVNPDDDPKVHHDMLMLALQSNQFTPEQEKVLADLISKYKQLAQQNQPASGQPAMAPAAGMPVTASVPMG